MNNRTPHTPFDRAIESGVVYRKDKGSYTVRIGPRAIVCALAARLRQSGSDPVAVGDHVRVSMPAGSLPAIVEILPRANQFSRRAVALSAARIAAPVPGAYAAEQVIAANVDQVVPVFAAANPDPRWNLLDRYLVTAAAHDLPALVCITKLDLAPAEDSTRPDSLAQNVAAYRQIGYPVLLVSARTGEGLDALKQALGGKISVLLGKSGVGKTSLLNALQPGLGLRVNEISRANGKGKHTTTHMEMFPLDWGGALVDTPGVREFSLWDIDVEALAFFFPEMRPYLGRCKFGANCQHDEEPGCAVRKAVMGGQVYPRRYQSYLRMREDALLGER